MSLVCVHDQREAASSADKTNDGNARCHRAPCRIDMYWLCSLLRWSGRSISEKSRLRRHEVVYVYGIWTLLSPPPQKKRGRRQMTHIVPVLALFTQNTHTSDNTINSSGLRKHAQVLWWRSFSLSHLRDEDTKRREHGHASVLDLGLAPLLDFAGGGAVRQAERVEDLFCAENTTERGGGERTVSRDKPAQQPTQSNATATGFR